MTLPTAPPPVPTTPVGRVASGRSRWLSGLAPIVLIGLLIGVFTLLNAPGVTGGADRVPQEEVTVENVQLHPGQIVLTVRNEGADPVRIAQVNVSVAVGPDAVPTVATIRERFEGHRARGGWVRVVNKLMGMDLKLAQYRDGAAFCRAVIDRVGVAGLNAVYESPGLLPTLEEIHHPDVWLARAHPVTVPVTDAVAAGSAGRPEA